MPYNHLSAGYAVITAVIEQQELAYNKSGDCYCIKQGCNACLFP